MADWTWTTASALTQQLWANRFWVEAKTESYFYGQGFVGPSETNDIIVEFGDLNKEQGSQITFGQIRELGNAGIQGDATLEGNEEAPNTYDDAITIDQWRNAIRTKGKLSEQYPSDKATRKWAKELLRRWMSEKLDQDLFDAIGDSLTKVIYGGDATSTATIESGDYMTLQLISKCVAYGKKATPKIKGKMIKGRETPGVIVISPDHEYDLTERDASWAQAQREAMRRGNDNPIFTGALGVHKGVPIHSHERVALSTTWGGGAVNGATALYMGVASGAIAYAKKRIWNEKTFDYGNKVGFAIGAIYGVTKAVFNSSDNAVVGVRTFRTNN